MNGSHTHMRILVAIFILLFIFVLSAGLGFIVFLYSALPTVSFINSPVIFLLLLLPFSYFQENMNTNITLERIQSSSTR